MSLGFRGWGSGFRVWGFGFRVLGFGFRVMPRPQRVPGEERVLVEAREGHTWFRG